MIFHYKDKEKWNVEDWESKDDEIPEDYKLP